MYEKIHKFNTENISFYPMNKVFEFVKMSRISQDDMTLLILIETDNKLMPSCNDLSYISMERSFASAGKKGSFMAELNMKP